MICSVMDMKSVLQSSYFFINSGFIVNSNQKFIDHYIASVRQVVSVARESQ